MPVCVCVYSALFLGQFALKFMLKLCCLCSVTVRNCSYVPHSTANQIALIRKINFLAIKFVRYSLLYCRLPTALCCAVTLDQSSSLLWGTFQRQKKWESSEILWGTFDVESLRDRSYYCSYYFCYCCSRCYCCYCCSAAVMTTVVCYYSFIFSVEPLSILWF